MGNNTNASTANSISANTVRSSRSREVRTTAAEITEVMDSTEVSLSSKSTPNPKRKKMNAHRSRRIREALYSRSGWRQEGT